MKYDLVVCVRCHANPALILDAVDAAKWSCDPSTTLVVCAVDGVERVAEALKKVLPADQVYCSSRKWGWGVGLYTLLIGSIEFFESKFEFSHFVSIDYDTLFLRERADQQLLSYVVDPEIGLFGHRQINNEHWRVKFERERRKIEKNVGSVPTRYVPGEGVQGGCMLLTRMLIDRLHKRGYFSDQMREPGKFTSIADDHLLPLFTRICGLDIGDMSKTICCRWKSTEDPRGMEKKDIYVYHPSKIKPGKGGEMVDIQVRNYFREIRGQSPLKFH